MAVIDQIDIRRGNASGTVTTTTYDIGAKAENVILSDGTTVEAAISGGGSVKFEGFGKIIQKLTVPGNPSTPVMVYELYGNPDYRDSYKTSPRDPNKAGIFILRFEESLDNYDCARLNLISKADKGGGSIGEITAGMVPILKNGTYIQNEGLDTNMTVIFLRNYNSTTAPQDRFEWIGDNFTPRVGNGNLVLI